MTTKTVKLLCDREPDEKNKTTPFSSFFSCPFTVEYFSLICERFCLLNLPLHVLPKRAVGLFHAGKCQPHPPLHSFILVMLGTPHTCHILTFPQLIILHVSTTCLACATHAVPAKHEQRVRQESFFRVRTHGQKVHRFQNDNNFRHGLP